MPYGRYIGLSEGDLDRHCHQRRRHITHLTKPLKTSARVWKGTVMGRLFNSPSRGEMYAICRLEKLWRLAQRGTSPISSSSTPASSESSNLPSVLPYQNPHCSLDETFEIHLGGHHPEIVNCELSPCAVISSVQCWTYFLSASRVIPLVNNARSSSVPRPDVGCGTETSLTPFIYPQKARSRHIPAISSTSSIVRGLLALFEKNSSSGVRRR
jgi:hypothetical protein